MGERGLIRTENENGLCVYLHWNGWKEDVEALLKSCEEKGYVSPSEDSRYGWSCLVHEACNMFGAGRGCVGVEVFNPNCDYWLDHGVYVIRGWKIIEHQK